MGYRDSVIKKINSPQYIKTSKVDLLGYAYKNLKCMSSNHYYLLKKHQVLSDKFIEIYNHKCQYCGVSDDVINNESFQREHFIPKETTNQILENVHIIDNLVLSCPQCNNYKSTYIVHDSLRDFLHPDESFVDQVFIRNDDYSISIDDKFKNNSYINEYYDQLKFKYLFRRIDYLIMEMKELVARMNNNSNLLHIQSKISNLADNLRKKRYKAIQMKI